MNRPVTNWEGEDLRTVQGDLDPRKIAHDIETHGAEWANLKAAADLLEKTNKALLAQLTNKARAESPGISRREAQDLAEGSAEYAAHITKTVGLRRDANLARVKYEAAQVRFEAMRTVEATKRAEMATLSRR